jgi:hypothetical protein
MQKAHEQERKALLDGGEEALAKRQLRFILSIFKI